MVQCAIYTNCHENNATNTNYIALPFIISYYYYIAYIIKLIDLLLPHIGTHLGGDDETSESPHTTPKSLRDAARILKAEAVRRYRMASANSDEVSATNDSVDNGDERVFVGEGIDDTNSMPIELHDHDHFFFNVVIVVYSFNLQKKHTVLQTLDS